MDHLCKREATPPLHFHPCVCCRNIIRVLHPFVLSVTELPSRFLAPRPSMASMSLTILGAAFSYLTSASVIVRRDLTPPITPKNGWSYTGCFVDSVSSRSLSGAVYYDSTDLTAETCVAYCAGAGYSYAGIEYAVECCKSTIFQA